MLGSPVWVSINEPNVKKKRDSYWRDYEELVSSKKNKRKLKVAIW